MLRVVSEISGTGALLWWVTAPVVSHLWGRLAIIAVVAAVTWWMRLGADWARRSEGLGWAIADEVVVGVIGSFAFAATGLWIASLAHMILVATAVRVTLEEHGVTRAFA